MIDVRELLTTRRTVRRFRPDPVDRALVEELVEMAVTAPSASNKQPWRFFATDRREHIEAMASSVDEAVEALRARIPDSLQGSFLVYRDYFLRFREAPVVMAVTWRPLEVLSHLLRDDPDPAGLESVVELERTSGLASTAMAIQNLLLYAHSVGLGTTCMTGPLVATRGLRPLLGIPAAWRLAALVAIGYPAEIPERPSRKPVEAVLRWVE